MSEKVLFEYIADDGEGNSQTKMSGDFLPKVNFGEDHCGVVFNLDGDYPYQLPKRFNRTRRRMRKTLAMFENFYDEIFSDDEST
jgi:hypothetical protein